MLYQNKILLCHRQKIYLLKLKNKIKLVKKQKFVLKFVKYESNIYGKKYVKNYMTKMKNIIISYYYLQAI